MKFTYGIAHGTIQGKEIKKKKARKNIHMVSIILLSNWSQGYS